MNTAAPHVRFLHLEKLYGYLPGIRDALPSIFGLTTEEYDDVVRGFADRAREAAESLLAENGTAELVATLRLKPGSTILAVGDSVTDDLLSWAEILRHVFALARPDDAPHLINAGLSAHTSAMVLRRWPSMLESSPHLVLCCLGGNDVTRVAGGKPQVTIDESVANLVELRRIAAARTTADWIWMTPVPVLEERVDAHPAFRHGASSWRNADIERLADAIRRFNDPVVDLSDVFGVPAAAELQSPDGVHPSAAGQKAIAAAVISRMALADG